METIAIPTGPPFALRVHEPTNRLLSGGWNKAIDVTIHPSSSIILTASSLTLFEFFVCVFLWYTLAERHTSGCSIDYCLTDICHGLTHTHRSMT